MIKIFNSFSQMQKHFFGPNSLVNKDKLNYFGIKKSLIKHF